MMKTTITSLAVLALSSGVAMASPISWNFDNSGQCSTNFNGYGNKRTCTVDGQKVAATAWANTLGSANVAIQDAKIVNYSGHGLGVTNRDRISDGYEGLPPEHAIDNNDRYDFVLLTFDSLIKLSSLKLGYISGDSDISVLAYTGLGVAPLAGLGYGGLLGKGWSLVGNYADVPLNTDYSINGLGLTSSYWLVGAYNSVFGTGSGLDTCHYETINNKNRLVGCDNIKLKVITGMEKPPSEVDEPAVLGLFGLGMMALGMSGHRRYKA